VALWLQLFALACVTTESSIGKAHTVELETLIIFAFATLAPLLGLLQSGEVLLLGDGLVQDFHRDLLYLLLFFLDILLLILLGSTSRVKKRTCR
jgi:hypothetical protein